MVDGTNCMGSSGNGSVNRKQLATIIRSEVLGAGANALASLPGFTIGKAWEQAYERMRVASHKSSGLKVVGPKPYWPYHLYRPYRLCRPCAMYVNSLTEVYICRYQLANLRT